MPCSFIIYDEGFEVAAPYHEKWLDEIKEKVWPRKWHSPDKTWVFRIASLELVTEICERHLGYIHVIDRRGIPEPDYPPPVDETGEVIDEPLQAAYLLLTTHAPEAALRKLHMMTLAAVHPDAGGDHETAVAINNAWDVIRKARGFE